MTMQTLMHVQTSGAGVLSRRTFLRSAAALGVAGTLGWKDLVTAQAAELRKKGMACILLFMRGGPSQLETFDPKPGTTNGGPTQAIDTAASGIRIAEHWPQTAKMMKDIALIRSMTNKEGEHQRAVYQLHTGYVPSGSAKYPSFGSLMAAELGPRDFELPHFVAVGNRVTTINQGFLGMEYAPFVVANPAQMPANVELPAGVSDRRLKRRLGLMKGLEEDFARSGAASKVEQHGALYTTATQMVLSPELKAFDLSQEKSAVRDRYGRSSFGQGCLLARRLVEHGVTFIEVESNGWDTHDDNFERVKGRSAEADPGFAALVGDLKERGMLDRTLVVWMGEFGRTPRINPRGGRDHYPRAFSAALAGGGVKGGQVIGATSDSGTDIKDRPVTVADLFCSFCQALKVNPHKERISNTNRPVKLVDGGLAVKELFA